MVDLTPPVLLSTTPSDDASGVRLTTTDLVLNFDEPVMAGAGDIDIYRADGSLFRTILVSDPSQANFLSDTLTLHLGTWLPRDTGLYVTVPSGAVLDLAGNPFAGFTSPTALNFSTHVSPDTDPPYLLRTSPANVSTDVPANTNVVFTFSEPVVPGSGDIDLTAVGGGTIAFSVNDTSHVMFYQNTITIDPAQDLAPGTWYEPSFDSGSVLDLAGNVSPAPLLGFTEFKTADPPAPPDTMPPQLTASSPADNATKVPVGASISLTFNEPIEAGTGTIQIRKASNRSLLASFSIDDTSFVKIAGNTLTLNPYNYLASGTGYYVALSAGAVLDRSGNPYRGISTSTALNFTTESLPPDSTAPTLQLTIPQDDAVDVSVRNPIALSFSENVQPGTGNIEIHRSSDGSLFESIPITDASQVTFNGLRGVTVRPAVQLQPGTAYYIAMAPGVVKDERGYDFVGIASPAALNFTTAPTINIEHAFTVNQGQSVSITATPGSIATVAFELFDRPGPPNGPRGSDVAPSLTNYGNISVSYPSGVVTGITYDDSGSFYQAGIWNKPGGKITIVGGGTAYGMYSDEDSRDFVNEGEFDVTASGDAYGFSVPDPRSAFVNRGTFRVTGGVSAIGYSDLHDGVFNNSGDFEVTNTGDGSAVGVAIGAGPGPFGFVNSGSIKVSDGAGQGIGISYVHWDEIPSRFYNSGLIEADVALAEWDHAGGSPQHAQDIVDNSGTIAGAVLVGLGDDTLENTGVIRGNVDLGDGNDTFDGRGGFQTGGISGGAGDDRILGGVNGETLLGGGGNDYLAGGLAADNLEGDTGNDVLIGGGGGDVLNGNAGNDVFVFRALSDLKGGEVIGDFNPAEDQIDLSGISNLTFIGAAPFTGVAGQVNYIWTAGSGGSPITELQVDSNGDGAADYSIALQGGDFALTSSILVDHAPPQLTNFSPASGAANVAIDSNIVLTFDEAVQPGIGDIELWKANVLVTAIPVNDTNQVEFAGSTVTINPADDLSGGNYHIMMPAGAVEDLAGSNFAGITSDETVNFTTVNTSAEPMLTSISPGDDAAGVRVDSDLVLTFWQDVKAGSGNIVIHRAMDGSVFASIPAGDTGQVTFSGQTVTIDPVINLHANESYYVTIDGGAITDLSGYPYAGILENMDFNFSTVSSLHVPSDFNGDFHSDILWQNTNGQAAIWTVNGLNQIGGTTVGSSPGTSWHVKGAGDFNGDGCADILWQNDDGQAAIWLMDGLNRIGAGPVGSSPGAFWHVIGSGDFNGDGKADILWQNDNDQAAIWLMDGLNRIGAGPVGSSPGASWHVIGSGDFNGDGKSDILWQSDSGQAAVWLMDGLNRIGAGTVGSSPGTSWHVISSGDFNGDRYADILWQNDNGQAAIWLMDGLNRIGARTAGGDPGASWHAMGAGDFNGDGFADILWQNASGQAAVWTMNGFALLRGGLVGSNPGSSWHVIGMTG